MMAKRSPKADAPISFGYKCAWYALRTNDVEEVVAAMRLKSVAQATWVEGIDAAYADKVFVTPPLDEWVLAAGWRLFYAGDSPSSVEPLLTKLSKKFGEAQYFCSYRVADAHCWALARAGKTVRAFGYLGERGEITWKKGRATKAELELGDEVLDFPGPSESDVMEVAGAWSVNPSEIETKFIEPSFGRIGVVA